MKPEEALGIILLYSTLLNGTVRSAGSPDENMENLARYGWVSVTITRSAPHGIFAHYQYALTVAGRALLGGAE